MKRLTNGCDIYILLIAEPVVTIVYTCLPPAVLIICAPAGIPVHTRTHPVTTFTKSLHHPQHCTSTNLFN